jgi:hypothetical protein
MIAGVIVTGGVVNNDNARGGSDACAEQPSYDCAGAPFTRLLQICATGQVRREQRQACEAGHRI